MIGGLLPFTPLCATLAPTPPQVNPNRLHLAPLAPLSPQGTPHPEAPTATHLAPPPRAAPDSPNAPRPSRSLRWGHPDAA